jgi:hypothetical protein
MLDFALDNIAWRQNMPRKTTAALIVLGYITLALLSVGIYLHGASRQTIIRRFATLSYEDPNTWKRNHWLGVRTLQNPNDIWNHSRDYLRSETRLCH